MKVFGFVPTKSLPRWTYNSLCTTMGAAFYTDSLPHFIGLVLILEGILVSLEPLWPKE